MVKTVLFLLKTVNLTEPSSMMVADDVAMRAIMADPVLQWYVMIDEVMWGSGRNHHGAEVL